ncbi:unnamed protein product, partial [Effrenium voratum]
MAEARRRTPSQSEGRSTSKPKAREARAARPEPQRELTPRARAEARELTPRGQRRTEGATRTHGHGGHGGHGAGRSLSGVQTSSSQRDDHDWEVSSLASSSSHKGLRRAVYCESTQSTASTAATLSAAEESAWKACQDWEAWAQAIARAVEAGSELPAPPLKASRELPAPLLRVMEA